MEQERVAREKEEAEKKATEQKIKQEFGDTNSQWDKDKQEMQNLAAQQRADGSKADLQQDTPAKAADGPADGAKADVAEAVDEGGIAAKTEDTEKAGDAKAAEVAKGEA